MKLILFFCWTILATSAYSAPLFELRDGDRVALLGDAFIEREQYEGWIELAATTQFPDRAVTFRNLGWNGDTPAGESRNGLSLLQAGMEPPEEGWRQLLNQLAVYKPNVIVLGYGMAASLSGGQAPHLFKEDFKRLLDANQDARFLILGPPPRFAKPGEDAGQVDIHRGFLAVIDSMLRETAAERGIPFVSFAGLKMDPAYSQNGIHLTGAGYRAVARHIEESLGWKSKPWDQGNAAAALREHILKKNEWFFHRSRPANMAYIFGFRKNEQGKNAGEMAGFDKLVAEQDAIIAKMRDLSKNVVIPASPIRSESAIAAKVTQPYPEFTVADGFEISLWAENPLFHKPTQMNFDPSGRLWVASSESYPQVEVGQTPNDKVIVLEDSDADGKADKSKVFADGMMMPTAVLPGGGGVYVGQSTDLLHFKDTDGDGKADVKTRVLSGFGTEDTHHNLHTLRRGPDGRLWMNQSIYTRSDVETPGGIFRLKSGGIMRFNPRDSSLEAVFYGWCNAWGHQFDKYGQSFMTDGAGVSGISWGVPGAMYFTFARAPKILGSISPGSYPKFSGLEIIESPHFPQDWQGHMITCDFRAHRIVRFSIADHGSGFAAQEIGDLVRTDRVNFRPIDVKIGPDGALYIADWSNPIINHGEVDFRDPRRDREHGRIWRVTKKGSPLAKVRDFNKLPEIELLEALTSDSRNDREQATAVLFESRSPTMETAIKDWTAAATDDRALLAALWLNQTRNLADPIKQALLKKLLASKQPEIRAATIRAERGLPLASLKLAIADEHPRVRLEAIRALAKLPGWEAMDVALAALEKPTDRFINYALWLNVHERGEAWFAALLDKTMSGGERAKALEFVLGNLQPDKANAAISQLLPKPLPKDGSGPWLNLAVRNGDTKVLGAVYEQAFSGGFDAKTTETAVRGINDAITQRGIQLAVDFDKLLAVIDGNDTALRLPAIALAGIVGAQESRLIQLSQDTASSLEIQVAAADALSNFKSPDARNALLTIASSKAPATLRQHAILALARHHRNTAVPLIAAYAAELTDAGQARQFWQQALLSKGISEQLSAIIAERKLSSEIADGMLQYIPDVPEHDALLTVLRDQAGSARKTYDAERIKKMADSAAAKGDPARGEMVYRRMSLACVACHAIGGAGGKVGPDMTSIGASAPLDYLIESVVNPGAKIKEGYHSVFIETKDGKAIMGQLIKSGGGSLTIRDGAGAEVVIPDSMVAKKTDAGSLMPGNLIAALPENEVNDLFKFLSVLGKPGEYDATKSKAPKVWAVLAMKPELQEIASKGDPSMAWVQVNATVDGRLLAADAQAAVGSVPELLLATKLQLSEPAQVVLEFPAEAKPSDIWIDGDQATDGSASLSPGIHKIVIRIRTGGPVQMKCDQGTFLPEW